MIRKSTWLVLCLCGLLVMALGCGKKKEDTAKPLDKPVTAQPTSNPVPPPTTEAPMPGANTETAAPVVSPTGPPMTDGKPMTAKQMMDQKAKEGAPMEEIEGLGVPE